MSGLSATGVLGGAATGAAAGAVLGPIGALAGGVIGGALSFFGGLAEGNKQRELTDEYVRRMRLENERKLGLATAAGAASGVEFGSSSLQLYLTRMAEEFRQQSEWAQKVGYDTASSLQTTGGIQGFANVGASLFDFAKANNYWRTPSLTAPTSPLAYAPGGSHEGYT